MYANPESCVYVPNMQIVCACAVSTCMFSMPPQAAGVKNGGKKSFGKHLRVKARVKAEMEDRAFQNLVTDYKNRLFGENVRWFDRS